MELKNTIAGLKYSIESINNRLDHIKETIGKLKDYSFEISYLEEQKEKE